MFKYLAVAVNSVGGGHDIRLLPPWNWDTCYVQRYSWPNVLSQYLVSIFNPNRPKVLFLHIISFFSYPTPWRVSSGCTIFFFLLSSGDGEK